MEQTVLESLSFKEGFAISATTNTGFVINKITSPTSINCVINHVNGHNKIRLYVIHKVYSSNQLKCCCQQGQQPLSTLVLLSTWSTANINQVRSHYQNICYQPGNSHYQYWLCYLQSDQQQLLTLVLLWIWSTATINIGCDNNKVNSTISIILLSTRSTATCMISYAFNQVNSH